MGDEVDLQEPRHRLVPIREGPDGNLPAGLRRRLPLPAVTRRAADRRQQPVDGRRTGREEELTDLRVERQMAVPLHGRDQAGQDGFEAFATDAIRGFPEDDEGLADRLGVDRPAEPGCLGHDGIDSREQADRMLAMTAGDGDELIEDLGFVELRCDSDNAHGALRAVRACVCLLILVPILRLQRLVTFW